MARRTWVRVEFAIRCPLDMFPDRFAVLLLHLCQWAGIGRIDMRPASEGCASPENLWGVPREALATRHSEGAVEAQRRLVPNRQEREALATLVMRHSEGAVAAQRRLVPNRQERLG